ncbi:hypothetical protein F0562_008200 [Nyssa sinensis]|uniref:P-type ATPase A domain-containing protein n=1 Tax=Nyssa sinensis TaxID=561372 RepID=A0A5J5AAW7_9ASTE|nr:hypothetical protein F0562_008200 [Nyssa sinensis]
MSQTNTSDRETGFPISTPTSSERYKRLWKLSICVGVFVTLNRSSPSVACLPPISTRNSSPQPEVKIDIDIDVAFDGEEEVDCNGCDAVKEQPRPPVPNTVDQIVEEKDSRIIISLNTSSPSDAPLPSTSSGSSSQADVLINIYTPLDNVDCNELQQLHRNTVDQIVKERDLNALTDFGGTERVISIFGSHLETGLSAGPSDPTASHTTNPAKHFFRFFLKACRSFTIFFLVVSAGLSLFTEILQEGSKYGWHDGAIILMVVFLLVTLPSVSNFLRARKLEKEMLMRDNRLEVEIRRNGESQFVSISNIVQGDIVCLKEGNRVPGDGLYVEGDGLVVDEVLDSNIDRHHNPFLLSGSKVIEGNGHMIVTSVNTTPIGESMSMVNDVLNHKPTLLQTLIEEPNEKHHDNKELPEIKGKVRMEEVMKIFERALLKPRGLLSFLATYLPAVVLGFQHGVSLAITDSLSYWNAKALSDDANPQNLSACGTMGFVTVICIDVSGGLTCSQMEVGKFFIGEKETNIHGEDCETSQIVPEALLRGIGISVLLPDNLKGPTDDLLNSWVQSKWGQSMDLWKENFVIVRQRSFNKKGRGVLIRKNGNEDDETIMHLHWKGSANTILGMCSHYHYS